jgi:hypothetical protein
MTRVDAVAITRRHGVGLPDGHRDHVPQRESQLGPKGRGAVEKGKIDVDWPANEGSNERVLDLPSPIPGQIHDSELNAGPMKCMQICPYRMAIAGSVEHVPIVGEVDPLAGRAVVVRLRGRRRVSG